MLAFTANISRFTSSLFFVFVDLDVLPFSIPVILFAIIFFKLTVDSLPPHLSFFKKGVGVYSQQIFINLPNYTLFFLFVFIFYVDIVTN
ncbi:hypothetical protein A2442_00295 [Candidatus Campbellbacteria bacterium RIFOXYC2_FULL_35_25]|uniref:Uncharacterized protein n=1 Tax=Candidatus Campbellbacteria bacterium RIFOXYC2_FULL_35_25 TaxID=1797582 RepID=A0A1F5EI06_9BACT|nr:MAG: hypothetical protein A2442_00295 [Candidatus Campbellbacteria bacterium RIFOXYC2_FULL_35_25]